MTEVRRNTLVGLFMICALGTLGFLMMMFGETPSWLGGAEYEIKIHMHEISGIMDGTPVFLNGIKVGRVTELDFLEVNEPDKGVIVSARIENDFVVPAGAKAICYAPSLGLGRGRVDIIATGLAMQPLDQKDFIIGTMGNPFEGVIPETLMGSVETTFVKVGEFADELTPVARDLHVLLEETTITDVDLAEPPDEVAANLYTAVQRLDTVLKHIDEVVGDRQVQGGLKEGIENLLVATRDVREAAASIRRTSTQVETDAARLSAKAESTIDNVNGRVDEIAEATMPILDDAARLATNLREISAGLARGEGTAGLLLKDPRLYESMVLTFDRLIDGIDSARRLLHRWEKSGKIGIYGVSLLGDGEEPATD